VTSEPASDQGAAATAAPGSPPSGPLPLSGSRAVGPRVAGGVLVAVGVALLVNAIQAAAEDGVTLGGPRLAPLIVSGAWVALATTYWVTQLVAPSGERIVVRTPALVMAALIGYALVLKYTVIGYIIATAVFFFVTARLLSMRRLREVVVRDAIVAVALSVAIYLAFTRLLGISLPAGVLPL